MILRKSWRNHHQYSNSQSLSSSSSSCTFRGRGFARISPSVESPPSLSVINCLMYFPTWLRKPYPLFFVLLHKLVEDFIRIPSPLGKLNLSLIFLQDRGFYLSVFQHLHQRLPPLASQWAACVIFWPLWPSSRWCSALLQYIPALNSARHIHHSLWRFVGWDQT